MSWPTNPVPAMPLAPQPPTLWSVPIDPLQWPAGRWAMQIVSGAFLVLFFGFAFVLFDHPLALLFTVPTLGLVLACMMNGVKVWRKQRRYTTLGVLRIMLVLAIVGVAVQPGLGLFTQVFVHRASGNDGKLKEVQKELMSRPNDPRCEPARWLMASALRGQYEPILAALDREPEEKDAVDPEFRKAFRAWIDDLSRSGSPRVHVQLIEDVDPEVPASAKIELLIWQNDPNFKHLNWTNKHDPFKPKMLWELPEGFPAADREKHAKGMAAALQGRFGGMLDSKLADWQVEPAGGNLHVPTIAFHGRFKHSGTFVKMDQPGFRDLRSPLCVMPAVSWDVKLYDRRDRLVGEMSIPDLVDKNFIWTQQSKIGQPDLGSYRSVLAMVYGRTAWEVMRRAGLKAGPPPTVFP